ncbi:MAG: tetratricopeptide repeat protein [Rubricoccaceae bacterium]
MDDRLDPPPPSLLAEEPPGEGELRAGESPASARWRRIEALFEAAAAHRVETRAAFLDARCRDAHGRPDPTLRAEVEALLAADAPATAFFDIAGRRLAGLADAATHEPDLPAPERAGPWRLGPVLGRGGMGTVFRAERADGAYAQTAAVKVLRLAPDPALVARFRAERQILARLDHAGIARLLDGGLTPDGRPYLAMEFVDGEPITDYAEQRGLPLDARLALFLEVCAAVGYAHRHLVVHRDLKPSNILVTAEGHVKLLDFGIAKVIAGPDGRAGADSDATDLTTTGRRLLTPAYAAPEQICGDTVTTAADVFALGVLLCELLTGRRPPRWDDGEYRAADPVALLGREGLAARADALGLAPRALARRLRGDLCAILRCALAPRPEDRYSTAEALARDVQRHCAWLPVEARPDRAGYRIGRFVLRHRTGVAAVLALVLVSLGFVGVYGQRVHAESRRAAEAAAQAEAVAAFMTDLLSEFDPNLSRGGLLAADSVMARAVARVRNDLQEQPAVQALLFSQLGKIHQSYAQFDAAERLLKQALALRRHVLPPHHPDVGRSLRDLGWFYYVRGDYDAAEHYYEQAMGVLTQALGMENTDVAAVEEGLGMLARVRGNYDLAERRLREALRVRRRLLPPDHTDVVASENSLAYALYNTRRYAEAEQLYRHVVATRRRQFGAHAQTAQALSDYAMLLVALERYTEALELHREALAMRQQLLGPEHPHVALSLTHVGWIFQQQERYAEAAPLYQEALAIQRRQFGEQHMAVSNTRLVLGEALLKQGLTEQGLEEVAGAVAAVDATLGAGSRAARVFRLRFAEALAEGGRLAEARAVLAPVHAALRADGGGSATRSDALAARLSPPRPARP